MNRHQSQHAPKFRRLAAIAAAVGAIAAAPAFAAPSSGWHVPSGDIMDVPMDAPLAPVVHAGVTPAVVADGSTVASDVAVTAAAESPFTPAAKEGPLTRQDVRDAWANAKNAGAAAGSGEGGDTEQIIANREAFNELQREVYTALWADEARQYAEAMEAERAAIVAQQELDAEIEAVIAMSERREEDAAPLAYVETDRRDVIDERADGTPIVADEPLAAEPAPTGNGLVLPPAPVIDEPIR